MEKTNIFKCKPPKVHFTIRDRVPYNKLLTNLACSSHTGEYWPSVVFVQTSLRSVRTATTSGQYSPVRPTRSVSKRLIISIVLSFSKTLVCRQLFAGHVVSSQAMKRKEKIHRMIINLSCHQITRPKKHVQNNALTKCHYL